VGSDLVGRTSGTADLGRGYSFTWEGVKLTELTDGNAKFEGGGFIRLLEGGPDVDMLKGEVTIFLNGQQLGGTRQRATATGGARVKQSGGGADRAVQDARASDGSSVTQAGRDAY